MADGTIEQRPVERRSVSESSGKPRTRAEIEADLQAARERLARNVEDLVDQVHPNRIKQREVARVKGFARAEFNSARAQVVNPDGSLRIGRLVAVGGAVGGLVTFLMVLRAIVRRGRRRAGQSA